jgi:3-methyladenine DNA glycosylase AlkD
MTRPTQLTTLSEVNRALRSAANPAIAAHSKRFFKAGPGEYGEGDRFLGIRVPVVRQLARQARGLPLDKTKRLLDSPLHEARLMALVLLNEYYNRGDVEIRDEIYRFYLASTEKINNWDLVDASAHKIVGPHLENRSRKPLDRLAASSLLWDRRVAIIATYHFIRQGETETTFRLARKLRDDPHDLIHKAVGWMLREAGKSRRKPLLDFLDRHAHRMPRTMLRYAIEKLTPAQRKKFMAR